MNIFEIAEKFKISIHTLRKLEKAGLLLTDYGESEHGARIRFQFAKGQSLTVAQQIEILEDPSILRELGPYRIKAEEEIASLGEVRGEAAPLEVAAHITDAADRRDKDSIGVLIDWMKTVIPAEPITHHWLAVRLLMGLQANMRNYDVPRIQRALLNCRNSADFKGWWRVEKNKSRTQTLYQRPEVRFDL